MFLVSIMFFYIALKFWPKAFGEYNDQQLRRMGYKLLSDIKVG